MYRYGIALGLVCIASVAHAQVDCTAVDANQTVAYNGGFSVAHSPDASYADSPCKFVVDFTDVYQRTVHVIPMPPDNTVRYCPGALVDSRLWGWVPAQRHGR